jgi:hypothetical protein
MQAATAADEERGEAERAEEVEEEADVEEEAEETGTWLSCRSFESRASTTML